ARPTWEAQVGSISSAALAPAGGHGLVSISPRTYVLGGEDQLVGPQLCVTQLYRRRARLGVVLQAPGPQRDTGLQHGGGGGGRRAAWGWWSPGRGPGGGRGRGGGGGGGGGAGGGREGGGGGKGRRGGWGGGGGHAPGCRKRASRSPPKRRCCYCWGERAR